MQHGVVKVNVDTDLQWAYLTGIRDYITKNIDYLKTQVVCVPMRRLPLGISEIMPRGRCVPPANLLTRETPRGLTSRTRRSMTHA